MYFEHVIQVNDLNNPMATTLSRQVLWRGLVRRAERPQDFLDTVNDEKGVWGCDTVLRCIDA